MIDREPNYNKRNHFSATPYSHYASAEFTVSGGSVNYDVASGTTLFDNIHVGSEVLIRIYDNEAAVRFNSQTADIITIPAGSQFGVPIQLSNIYVTASGGDVLARIYMTGYR